MSNTAKKTKENSIVLIQTLAANEKNKSFKATLYGNSLNFAKNELLLNDIEKWLNIKLKY